MSRLERYRLRGRSASCFDDNAVIASCGRQQGRVRTAAGQIAAAAVVQEPPARLDELIDVRVAPDHGQDLIVAAPGCVGPHHADVRVRRNGVVRPNQVPNHVFGDLGLDVVRVERFDQRDFGVEPRPIVVQSPSPKAACPEPEWRREATAGFSDQVTCPAKTSMALASAGSVRESLAMFSHGGPQSSEATSLTEDSPAAFSALRNPMYQVLS